MCRELGGCLGLAGSLRGTGGISHPGCGRMGNTAPIRRWGYLLGSNTELTHFNFCSNTELTPFNFDKIGLQRCQKESDVNVCPYASVDKHEITGVLIAALA